MKNTLISVIIPVYNEEKYIGDCLDSLLRNSNQNIEILCVDDGSTDHTNEILTEYQKKDNRIKVIRQDNRGVSSARNNGLDNMSGDYVCFVDGDDEVTNDFFSTLLYVIDQSNADIIGYDFYKDVPEDIADREYKTLSFENYLDTGHLRKYACSQLLKARILDGLRFDENLSIAEDEAFNVELACRLMKESKTFNCVYLQRQIYHYRDTPGSAVRSASVDRWVPICKWFKEKAEKEELEEYQSVYVCEGMKKMFTTRYNAAVWKNSSILKVINTDLKLMNRLLRKNRRIPISKKVLFSLFHIVPELYRQFRIHDDPTLLEYEKNVRRMLKNSV